MKTLIIFLTLFVAFLAGYDEITENISELTSSTGIPIILLIKIAGIILLLYWITYFLLKFLKKRKIKKLKQPLGIYNSRTYSKLPPEKEIIKIIKFIIEHQIIKHSYMVNDLGYSDIRATNYLSQLENNRFIQENILDKPPYKNYTMGDEISYLIDKKGREFAVDHNLD